MMPISLHEDIALENQAFPTVMPQGSVYQPTSFFPTKRETVPMTPLPPSSNFAGTPFPVSVYDRGVKGFGNPLDVYSPNYNSGSR